MNFSYFLSQKLISKDKRSVSKPVVRISIVSVALGICILLLTFAITTGFRNEIRDKVVGLASHIKVAVFDNNNSYESSAVFVDTELLTSLKQINGLIRVQPFTTKACIVKTENDVEGLVFKGIDASYDARFFVKNLVKGSFITLSDSAVSNEVLISEKLAKKLQLDTGKKISAFFIQNPVRQRVFTIRGIYHTGLEEYDNRHIICDMAHLQKINDWRSGYVGGLEIVIDDFDKLNLINEQIRDVLPYNLQSATVVEQYAGMFDWIQLFDQNVFILIFLVIIIAGVSLISTQLILSLEHISTIGLLKALGCTTSDIRNIFLFLSAKILGLGLLFGNAVGLLLCFLQSHFQLFRLNPDNYYLSYVPIKLMWQDVILINLGAVLISFAVLIIPAHLVSRKTNAIKALRMN